jgi:hypothetical protein
LSVTHCPYDFANGSTAYRLTRRLIELLSPVCHENRAMTNETDWYATALEYLYFERNDISSCSKLYTTPRSYRFKSIDCRGCYSNYVEIAYILSWVFVWNVLEGDGFGQNALTLTADDLTEMIVIRQNDEADAKVAIVSDVSKDDVVDLRRWTIPWTLLESIKKSIRTDECDEDTDYDDMKVDPMKMCRDDIQKIITIINRK